jgi:hypothetical protein
MLRYIYICNSESESEREREGERERAGAVRKGTPPPAQQRLAAAGMKEFPLISDLKFRYLFPIHGARVWPAAAAGSGRSGPREREDFQRERTQREKREREDGAGRSGPRERERSQRERERALRDRERERGEGERGRRWTVWTALR